MLLPVGRSLAPEAVASLPVCNEMEQAEGTVKNLPDFQNLSPGALGPAMASAQCLTYLLSEEKNVKTTQLHFNCSISHSVPGIFSSRWEQNEMKQNEEVNPCINTQLTKEIHKEPGKCLIPSWGAECLLGPVENG